MEDDKRVDPWAFDVNEVVDGFDAELGHGIVVDRIFGQERSAKLGNIKAITDAVVNTTRHLLSTTLTTIGGFLPLLLIVGGDFWPSLAIVLVGGVGGSMILALLFVPSVFVLMNRSARRPSTTPKMSDASLSGALIN